MQGRPKGIDRRAEPHHLYQCQRWTAEETVHFFTISPGAEGATAPENSQAKWTAVRMTLWKAVRRSRVTPTEDDTAPPASLAGPALIFQVS